MSEQSPSTEDLLRIRMVELRAQVDEIKGRTARQRARLQELVDQQNALDPEINRLSAEVHAHDDELYETKQKLSAVAIALGSKTLSGR